MQVAIRADASLDIGTGHVMRCLTLAEELRERGNNCLFVCRAHPGHLVELIDQRGFVAHALPPAEDYPVTETQHGGSMAPYSAWLGADWLTDAAQTLEVLAGATVDWLVVDHYAVDARWERRLRAACGQLMVIDDLAYWPHDCDLLLNQNLGRSETDYETLVQSGCTVLAGPNYALLRPEFAALRSYSITRRMRPKLRHLLISMGGVDRDNATGRVLEALKECSMPADCRVSVVMGPQAPWLQQVSGQAELLSWKVDVLVGVSDMAQLMADSDLAIGAAGTTAWERCCLGLPAVAVVLADNQLQGAQALEAAGAVALLEENQILSGLPKRMARIAQPEVLVQMQHACQTVADGFGAARVVEAMTNEQH